MSLEQLVPFLLAAGYLLLQVLGNAAKRRRDADLEGQSAPDASAQAPGEWWQPPPETAPPAQVRFEAPPPRPAAPRPQTAEPRAPGRPPQPAPPSRRQLHASPATRHRTALKGRAELRRAVELMAILGPPRSRVPDDF